MTRCFVFWFQVSKRLFLGGAGRDVRCSICLPRAPKTIKNRWFLVPKDTRFLEVILPLFFMVLGAPGIYYGFVGSDGCTRMLHILTDFA